MKTNRRRFIKTLGGASVLSAMPGWMWAQGNTPEPQTDEILTTLAKSKRLKFNADGKFKIVQLTDTHNIYQDERSKISLERIKEILDAEKPDLVIHTGDIIYGKPAKESLQTIMNLMSDRKIPFALAWGNHDAEFELTREQLLEIAQENPYNLTTTAKGISGVSNFILPIQTHNGDHTDRVLYMFDSHDYSKIEGVGGYDYIKFDQVEWYRKLSMKFTEKNGGKPVPSLAFFHIPLPEYKLAARDENTILFGVRKEQVCAPPMNSGLFTAMKEMGDMEGTFVGHDHDNDYAALWHGILLAYGRYSGGSTVYNDLPNGARVIELTEGKKGFKTWIRLKDGVIESEVTFPDSYLKK